MDVVYALRAGHEDRFDFDASAEKKIVSAFL